MATISRRAFLRRTTIGAGALVLVSSGFEFNWALAAGPETFRLKIIHTNDHHARIESESVGITAAASRSFGGLARRKTLVDQLRAAAAAATPNAVPTLLLDAGDVFQGTLYFNIFRGLADLAIYRDLGYDAMTIGNHEFDNGPADLAKFIQGATAAAGTTITPTASQVNPTPQPITLGGTPFPVLSANITAQAGSPLDGLIQPRTIVSRTYNGITRRIGIFGLTTEDTVFTSSPGATVSFSNYIEAARAQVQALQNDAGGAVDIIIALTHVGYEADLELARQVSGIDVIVGGHTHTALRDPANNSTPLVTNPANSAQQRVDGPYPTAVTAPDGNSVLVVTAWEWGKWLGDIEVGFDAGGLLTSGTVARIVPVWAEIPPTSATNPAPRALLPGEGAEITPDTTVQNRITNEFKPAVTALGALKIGSSATILDGERPNVRNRETNLGSLIADAMLNRSKTLDSQVQIAITNGGGIRASIPAGDVTVGQVRTVLPFGNTIARVDLTGAQIKAALENGVGGVNLTTPANSAGRFPQVAGLRFSWNPAAPAGERVVGVEVAEGNTFVALDPAKTYRIVTNNFMLAGGDNYTVFTQGANKLDLALDLALVLQDYITAASVNAPLNATTSGRILRVVSMLNTILINAAVAAP
jgi:5'-nucleotidase / UDP-sugar diphosphatase